jgi:hypothetical protein
MMPIIDNGFRENFSISFSSDYNNKDMYHLDISISIEISDPSELFGMLEFNLGNESWDRFSFNVEASLENPEVNYVTINLSKDGKFEDLKDSFIFDSEIQVPQIQSTSFGFDLFTDYANSDLYCFRVSVGGKTNDAFAMLNSFYDHISSDCIGISEIDSFYFNVSSDWNDSSVYNYYATISKTGNLDEIGELFYKLDMGFEECDYLNSSDNLCECEFGNNEVSTNESIPTLYFAA